MYITFRYQDKPKKLNVNVPITYEKLLAVASEEYGIPVDRIQLIVNRVQVTKHSDVNKLQLYIYPISVNRLSLLSIRIGKVSFSQSFCLSYRCNVLLSFILEVMKNSGFVVPQLDYRLMVNGHPVDMKERLEDVGCVENSEVTVETVNGDSLDDVFSVGKTAAEDQATKNQEVSVPSVVQQPVVDHTVAESVKQPASESAAEHPVSKPETRLSSDTPSEVRLSNEPVAEARASMESLTDTLSSHSPVDDAFVSSRQRKQRRVTESSAENAQSPTKEEFRQIEIPDAVREALKEMSEGLTEDSAEYRRVSTLREFADASTRQLNDVYAEYLRLKDLVDQIHYENQMLREMVNDTASSPEANEKEKAERQSWRRVSSDRASGESLSKELPDDPEALKKLVNEKYATALMNERRYLKEKKRCQKYRLIAEAAGMDDKSVDAVYVQLHEVLEHRDQLKEDNLNLKETKRALQQEIDARDDEIHRLRLTVQARDENIGQLADQIKEYDALLRENTSKGEASPSVEEQSVSMDRSSNASSQLPRDVTEPIEEHGDDSVEVACDEPLTGEQSVQKCEAEWRGRVESLENELREVREQLNSEKTDDGMQEKEKLEEECASLKRENARLESELREVIGGDEEEESVMTQLNGLIQVLMEKQTRRKERASTIFGNSI